MFVFYRGNKNNLYLKWLLVLRPASTELFALGLESRKDTNKDNSKEVMSEMSLRFASHNRFSSVFLKRTKYSDYNHRQKNYLISPNAKDKRIT